MSGYRLTDYDRQRCRSDACKAPIAKVRLRPSGKMTPVDFEPTTDGTIGIVEPSTYEPGFSEPPVAVIVAKARRAEWDGPLYRSHFASCPAAAEFRTRRANVASS